MTTVKTRDGRMQRARDGKVIGSGSPPYGYRYNPDRTNYEVDPVTMPIVRRMFEMVAAGRPVHSVAMAFESEGIPTPGGGERWYTQSIRRAILNDVYKGTWPYGRQRVKMTPMGEKRRSFENNPETQHIAVPVPDSGIPHEIIDAARANIESTYRPRRPSKHYYEVGGMVYCGECGLLMTGSTGDGFRYYSCQKRKKWGRGACTGPLRRADKLEREVARYVGSLLDNPERVRAHLDAAIAAESSRIPDEDALPWMRIVEDCDKKRAAYQDQQATGLMTIDELGSKLAQLDERKTTAQRELERLDERRRRVDELEATKRTLLCTFADGLLYDGIRWLTPEVRRHTYEAMKLRITVTTEGKPRIRCNVDQNVVRLTREVESWATEQSLHQDKLVVSSKRTDKVKSVMVNEEVT
jgi:site-specific DNA recombinase